MHIHKSCSHLEFLFLSPLFLGVYVFGVPLAWCDTLHLKDKSILKGVVVDEHSDRYIVSTADGEIPVFKSKIESVSYDDPEQSYYQLGRDLQKAGHLSKALEAYQKAAWYRPDFQAAREGIFQVQQLISQQDESQVVQEIQQKRILMEPRESETLPKDFEEGLSPRRAFSRRFGFELSFGSGWAVVTRVDPESPASLGGLQTEDLLVSIFGEPITNLLSERVVQELNSVGPQLTLIVDRRVTIKRQEGSAKGFRDFLVELNYDGLRITSVNSPTQGFLLAGDLILEINGKATRYLPLSDANQLLNSKDRRHTLLIRRMLVLREADGS